MPERVAYARLCYSWVLWLALAVAASAAERESRVKDPDTARKPSAAENGQAVENPQEGAGAEKDKPKRDSGEADAKPPAMKPPTLDLPPSLPVDPTPVDPLPIPEIPPPQTIPFRSAPNDAFQNAVNVRQDLIPTAVNQGPATIVSAEPVVYAVSNFYGRTPHLLSFAPQRPGEPWFQIGGNVSIGYDDNVNQTREGIGEPERVSSMFTSVGLNLAAQSVKPRQLLALNTSVGGSFYWNQADPNYHVDLGFVFQRRFLAPSQITANVRFAYTSEPDYSHVNVVPRESEEEGEDGPGTYLLVDAQIDYSHRWSPQLSSVTSLSGNTIVYDGGGGDEGNQLSLTLGNALRFRSGRYTWVGEARYTSREYLDVDGQDTDSLFALVGVEWHLGSWLRVSSRAGAELREEEAGEKTSSPYAEFAMTYQPNLQNAFSLNMRYGYETGAFFGEESETFRVGLSYSRVFSSRMTGILSANYIQNNAGGAESSSSDVTWNGSVSLSYRLSTRVSLGASFSSTRSSSDDEGDFERNRMSLSANFQF